MLAKYRKFVGALLGSVTGGVVLTVLGLFGVVLAAPAAAAIAAGLAAVGTLLAKANGVPTV